MKAGVIAFRFSIKLYLSSGNGQNIAGRTYERKIFSTVSSILVFILTDICVNADCLRFSGNKAPLYLTTRDSLICIGRVYTILKCSTHTTYTHMYRFRYLDIVLIVAARLSVVNLNV